MIERLPRTRLTSQRDLGHQQVAGQRHVARRGRLPHTGNGSNPLQYRCRVGGDPLPPIGRERSVEREPCIDADHVRRIETQVDRFQTNEGLGQEHGADEQHEA